VVITFALAAAISVAAAARPVTWTDLPPAIRARLEPTGVTAATLAGRLAAIDRDANARVREGDFDHLVFYVLQSTHFTRLPPIEPALSARTLLSGGRRDAARQPHVPADAGARIRAFIAAVESGDRDPRLAYFRALLQDAHTSAERRALVETHYRRAMAFLFQKEFAAAGSQEAAERLYQSRGLSTDTAVEAGYAVHTGLGVLKALDPSRRIRRVLIVGPGMDLAPRTGMLEAGPPESYQPWMVIDALVGLGLSTLDYLEVVGADINPRVVDHLRASKVQPPLLHLVSGIRESATLDLAAGYREYFAAMGGSVGTVRRESGGPAGHLSKAVAVSAKAAATLRAEPLDIVTERLDETFDLVIATNILPYFGGVELTLAVSNIAGMIAPGGVFLHNDTRPAVQEDAAAAGLAPEQLREVSIATIAGEAALGSKKELARKHEARRL
jgi:hypothetical protein